jgi:gamma-carbonic anhydrase
MKPLVLPYRSQVPRIAASAFVAPGAVVIGDAEIGEDSGIWFTCVVRADVNQIRIGARTNLQDGTIVHVHRAGEPTWIGSDVTVGHRCVLHGCRLEDRAFIGMDSTLLDGARVESDAMLAAGSLLTPGTCVPTGQLWAGRPARFLRALREEEWKAFPERAAHYVALAREYRSL